VSTKLRLTSISLEHKPLAKKGVVTRLSASARRRTPVIAIHPIQQLTVITRVRHDLLIRSKHKYGCRKLAVAKLLTDAINKAIKTQHQCHDICDDKIGQLSFTGD
jgi:hypothetical protein